MSQPLVPNVLCARYASAAMAELWSPRQKVIFVRQLWIAVMEAQRELGVAIPPPALEAYRQQLHNVDLD